MICIVPVYNFFYFRIVVYVSILNFSFEDHPEKPEDEKVDEKKAKKEK
jgi:hypothetical protein